ncbi:hypothetical protein EV363DRAFT_1184652 [Boletus edulis]|nr:hypothetical protein EV363DRAFT_1184652 [Boletus edulis]
MDSHTFTYIFKDGTKLPLTPYMIKEWAQAWVSSMFPMDVDNPPNTKAFDPSSRQAHLRHPSQTVLPTSTQNDGTISNELCDLTSILLLNVCRDLAKGTSTLQSQSLLQPPPASVPMTPSHSSHPESSALLLSPSKLPHFLEYAESALGVHNTTVHEVPLHTLGVGPDILDKLDDKVLHDVGISIGDTNPLERRLLKVWNGLRPDAKRKRADMNSSVAAATHVLVFAWLDDQHC